VLNGLLTSLQKQLRKWRFFHQPNGHSSNQWPFQDPKLEVPTIYKAYIYIRHSTSNLGSWNSHWSKEMGKSTINGHVQ
jgi:hypothetical protein